MLMRTACALPRVDVDARARLPLRDQLIEYINSSIATNGSVDCGCIVLFLLLRRRR